MTTQDEPAARRLAHLEAAERDTPEQALVCAVCRREFRNTAKGRAEGAAHWAGHVGKVVRVELENGGVIFGTPEAQPVFELYRPGEAPKIRHDQGGPHAP
jgi:hypothetical protein